MALTLKIGGVNEVKGVIAGWATTVVSAVSRLSDEDLPVSFGGARHLVLRFRDTTDHNDPEAFTNAMAATLIDFAREIPDLSAENIVVHCGAGIGRSPALAYSLLCATGLPPDNALALVLNVRPRARPNALVLAECDHLLDGGLWEPFERWAQTTDWWDRPRLRHMDRKGRLDGIQGVKTKHRRP